MSTLPELKPGQAQILSFSRPGLPPGEHTINEPKAQVPLSDHELDAGPSELVNTIFVKSDAFRAYFSTQVLSAGNEPQPAIARYSYLAHIRMSRSTRAKDSGTNSHGIIIGHRAGPVGDNTATTAYAHLVSLMGVRDNLTWPENNSLTALISLHSWSFTWQSDTSDIEDVIKKLQGNVRPLAREFTDTSAQNKWLKQRMDAGYTFVKHRMLSGETTVALLRDPLIPHQALPQATGAGEALTALLIKGPSEDSISGGLPDWFEALQCVPKDGTSANSAADSGQVSTVDGKLNVKAASDLLNSQVLYLADDHDWYARELSEPTKEGLLMVKVLDFIYNQLLTLKAIPHNHLFPEPDILEKEAVLSFSTDPMWLNSLIDGALSIGNHSTVNEDILRIEIKRAINMYLARVEDQHPRRSTYPYWKPDINIAPVADIREAYRPSSIPSIQLSPFWLFSWSDYQAGSHQQRFAVATTLSDSEIHIHPYGVLPEDVSGTDTTVKIDDIEQCSGRSVGDLERVFDFETRCLQSMAIMKHYVKQATAKGGSYLSTGSSALLSLVLGDRLQELSIVFDEKQADSDCVASLGPFQLKVPPKRENVPLNSWANESKAVTKPHLGPSSGSVSLGIRPISQPQYGAWQFTTQQGSRAVDLVVVLKAGEDGCLDTSKTGLQLRALNVSFPLGRLVDPTSATQPQITLVGQDSARWVSGNALVADNRSKETSAPSAQRVELYANFISDGYDANDVKYSSIQGVITTETNNLQTYAGAFEWLAPTGWSVIDAVAVAVRFLNYRTNNFNIPDKPSRCFLYCNARDVLRLIDKDKHWKSWPTDLSEKPVQLRAVLQGLKTFGIVSEDQFPWRSPLEKPCPRRSLYFDAEKTPLFRVLRLDHESTEGVTEPDVLRAIRTQILYRVRQCLSEGLIVMFAFHFYWPTFEAVPPASKDQDHPTIAMIPRGRRGVGPSGERRAHVVLAIDNDQANRRLLIKSNWIDSIPYFWMSYEWILDPAATEGFWTVSPSQGSPSQPKMWYRDGDFVHPWKDSNLVLKTPSPERIGDFQNSNIAVLPRGDNIVDIFWVNPAGRIVVGHYNKDRKNLRWRFAFVSDSGTATTGSVAAIRPWPKDYADRMEVFSITDEGHVLLSHAKVGDEDDPEKWEWSHDIMTHDWSKAVPEGCIVVTQPPAWAQWNCKAFWVRDDGYIGTAQNPRNVDGKRNWAVSLIDRVTDGSPMSFPTAKSSLATVSIPWEEYDDYWSALWWIDCNNYIRGLWVTYAEKKVATGYHISFPASHIRMNGQQLVADKSRISAAQSLQNRYISVYFQNSSNEFYTRSNKSNNGDPYPDDMYSHDIPVGKGSHVRAVGCERFWEALFVTSEPNRRIVYRRDWNGRLKYISEPGCLPDVTIMEQSKSHIFVKLHDGVLGILDLE
ncbi:hypothetical protein FAGAP_10375 [Fusarium agapanthi]|uniref:Fucose-specific lectin n=1 Tax=Fusarium agapanthi TaxID=1803897 RepID=A0A9P5B333_9HYPO|nr:hypothetical protein FAGAP_10375 [Fusarium agapanthi]